MTWVQREIERTTEASVRALYERIPDSELKPAQVEVHDGVFQVYRDQDRDGDRFVVQLNDETGETRSIKYNTFRAYVAAAKK